MFVSVSTMYLNIYVIHWRELQEREKCLDTILALASDKVSVKVIDKHDPDSMDMEMARKLIQTKEYPKDDNPLYAKLSRPLNANMLSNVLKHGEAIRMASEGDKTHYHLVLEDDVMFAPTLITQLTALVERMNQNTPWDIMLLGQPSDKDAVEKKTVDMISVKNNCLLPCCESYLMTTSAATKLHNAMYPIRFSTNIHLSHLVDKLHLDAYKIFPNVIGDGSKMGNYVSTINPNNVLIFNNIYKELYALLEKHYLSAEEITRVELLLKENPHPDNPDIMHLEGLFYKTQRQVDKSKQVFERALTLYKNNHAVMNNTTLFLRNYIELYKHDCEVLA